MTGCKGSEVYLVLSNLTGRAFPRRNSSKGFKGHRRRFNMTHTGPKMVATMVGR
jgi:hypothetical protein